jgi:hypothetical protein
MWCIWRKQREDRQKPKAQSAKLNSSSKLQDPKRLQPDNADVGPAALPTAAGFQLGAWNFF